jgi:hypothetical protein
MEVKMGSRRDHIKLVLAILSAGLIAFIVLRNFPGEDKSFQGDENSYYVPSETLIRGENDGSSYYALNGSSRVMCPGVDNTTPSGHVISVSGISSKANSFQLTKMPFTKETIGCSYTTISKDTVSLIGINSSTSSGTVSSYFGSATLPLTSTGTSYYEIIAPFSYNFVTNNVDQTDTKTISIVNQSGTAKMTVTGFVNWFCAGTPGTKSVYSSSGDEYSWLQHNDHHQTKIGYGSNVKSSGASGELLAYGDESTVVTFYVLKNGTWVENPLYNMILGRIN